MIARRARLVSGLALLALARTVIAQTPPSRNIDKILDDDISVDWNNLSFDVALSNLRDQTHANLVPNWPALADAGITHDTPVTVHLTSVPVQAAIRSLLLALPTKPGASLNFVIGGNAVELTTNARLAKDISTRLYPVLGLLARPVTGKPGTDPLPANAELLPKIVKASLAAIGEPLDPSARSITARDEFLVLTASRRAQDHALHILTMMEDPARIGTVPTPAAESVRAKHAADALNAYSTPAALLAAPPSPTLNVLVLPGGRSVPPAELDTFIDDAGIIEVGPRSVLQHRVVLCAYDLAELLRRRTLRNKSNAADERDAIIADIKANVLPTLWGPLDTAPSWLTPYANELIVQAPPAVQRDIASRLQELYK